MDDHKEESPILIIADMWNVANGGNLFASPRPTGRSGFVLPDLHKVSFSGLVEQIQSVVGSRNVLAFTALFRMPTLSALEEGRELQYDELKKIRSYLESEIQAKVEICNPQGKDVDSLIVGTMWFGAMSYLRKAALDYKPLPTPLEIALVSGDGIFTRCITELQVAMRGLLVPKFHIFSWEESLSGNFLHAMQFGKVHTVTHLSRSLRQDLNASPSKLLLEGV